MKYTHLTVINIIRKAKLDEGLAHNVDYDVSKLLRLGYIHSSQNSRNVAMVDVMASEILPKR